MHQRDKVSVTGASFVSCGKEMPAPHSPFRPVFKATVSQNGSTALVAGVLDTVLRWNVRGAHCCWHTHCVGFIEAKGTRRPFSRKVTSLGLAFGHRWGIFITRKPNSCHPEGGHSIPFLTLHTGQDNSHLLHVKHSNAEQQITLSPTQRTCLWGTFWP